MQTKINYLICYLLLVFLGIGCSTISDFEKLNGQTLNEYGVVVADSQIVHHGKNTSSALAAGLRNMNKRNKSKPFPLGEGMQVAIVEPGRYRLNIVRLDSGLSWIMLHKMSEEFDVNAGEIVYLGRIMTDVYHPGWKSKLRDPILWSSALTSSITGAVGSSVEVRFSIEDNGDEIRNRLAKHLQMDANELSFNTRLIQRFEDKPLFG